MPTSWKSLASALVAFFALTSAVQAVTIGFEGFANSIYSSDINRSGFLIGIVAGDEQHFHEISGSSIGLTGFVGSGVLLVDRNTRLEVTEASNAAFSLTSVLVAGYGNNGAMSISGYLAGNLVGNITTGALSGAMFSVVGTGLENVDRLVFDGLGTNGEFALDQLTLGAAQSSGVPDGGVTAALVGSVFVGFAALRRKRQA